MLLHGLMFDRTMWWPVAAGLACAACTVVAPDLPGHGQSPDRDDCRPERIARDLAVLLDGLALHRAPIVVGHGASAGLALRFAEAYAVHCVVTLDEPEPGELVGTAGLDRIPEVFRPYASMRTDPAVLTAYASWKEPAIAGSKPSGCFRHLIDPEGVAADLRMLL